MFLPRLVSVSFFLLLPPVDLGGYSFSFKSNDDSSCNCQVKIDECVEETKTLKKERNMCSWGKRKTKYEKKLSTMRVMLGVNADTPRLGVLKEKLTKKSLTDQGAVYRALENVCLEKRMEKDNSTSSTSATTSPSTSMRICFFHHVTAYHGQRDPSDFGNKGRIIYGSEDNKLDFNSENADGPYIFITDAGCRTIVTPTCGGGSGSFIDIINVTTKTSTDISIGFCETETSIFVNVPVMCEREKQVNLGM